MEVYDIINIENIYDLKEMCWSGALQRIDEVLELNPEKQEQFVSYVIEKLSYDPRETITTTKVNDFIWFECDDYIEELKEGE